MTIASRPNVDTTYKFTKRVLQSATGSIANSSLEFADVFLVACGNLLDVALREITCFVLAHGVECLLFELALEPWWDAEPG